MAQLKFLNHACTTAGLTMNSDEFAAALAKLHEALATTHAAMRQELLQLSHSVQDTLMRDLQSRIQLFDQDLIEERSKLRNALALMEARVDALTAYLAGGDVGEAFARARENFKEKEGATFDTTLWKVDPDWLIALRARGS